MTISPRAASRATGVLVALLLALGGLFASATPAEAHAQLLSTTPEDQAVLASAPDAVVFVFDEAATLVEGGFSVIGPDGEPVGTGEVTRSADGRVVTVPLTGRLARGTHVATWRIVSEDGHPIGGSTVFSIGPPTPLPRLEVAPGTTSVAGVATARTVRTFGYLSLLLLAGAITFRARERDDRTAQRLLLSAGWTVLGVAVATVLVDAAAVTGGGLAVLTDPTAWWAALGRPAGRAAMVLVIGGVAGLWSVRRAGRHRLVDAVAVTALLSAYVLEGHTLTTEPRLLTVFTALSHLAAAAVWSGGLVLLVLRLGADRAHGDAEASAGVVARFSGTAGLSLLAVVVSGSVLTWLEVGGLSGFATPYGAAVLTKIALVAVIAGVGAYNRYRLVPRVAGERGTWATLQRTLRVEVALIVLVLALTSTLVSLQPGAEAAEARLTTTVEETVDQYEYRMTVRPALAGGVNRTEISIRDIFGFPLHTEDVRVRFRNDAAGIEVIERTPFGDHGFWRIEGAEFAVPGTWTVEIIARIDDFEEIRYAFTVEIGRR